MPDTPISSRKRTNPEERFWAKVRKTDTCWLWTGGLATYGYGRLWIGPHAVGAHRFSYELANGPVPSGVLVCHSCDNPACVNPAHLWLGSAAENNRDRDAKGRARHLPAAWAGRRSKTVCSRGHPYSKTSLYISRDADGSTHRQCKECMRMRVRAYRQRTKVAHA